MPLRIRIRNAIRAFRGQEVIPDQGIQREMVGKIYTLAKLSVAAWIPTDSSDIAHAALGQRLEETFGPVDWDNGRAGKNTADLIAKHRGDLDDLGPRADVEEMKAAAVKRHD